MNISVIGFAVLAFVVTAFLLLTARKELGHQRAELTQRGDSALSRNSANWLVALAISAALVICFVLI